MAEEGKIQQQPLAQHTSQGDEDDVYDQKYPLQLYNADIINEGERENALRKNYYAFEMECCGFKEDSLDKKSIAEQKRLLKKRVENADQARNQNLASNDMYALLDGAYQAGQIQKSQTMNLHRWERRLIRDNREEFYKPNLQLALDREFYDDKVSRVVNISFDENPALAIYQKNAILSERSNQKKNEPFEIQLMIGQLRFSKHPMMLAEERKFEQIRPRLEKLQRESAWPELPYLEKLEQKLTEKHAQSLNSGASREALIQLNEQISKVRERARKERDSIQDQMRKILEGWKQIRLIRSQNNGTILVPWKVVVRESMIQGKKNYEIGLTSISETRATVETDPEQFKRRAEIQSEKYYFRLLVNKRVVGTTQACALQWPNFVLPVQQKFNIHVFTMPGSVKLEVVKSGLFDKVVDTIPLKLPGEFANTITASERRFVSQVFATNGDKLRKKEQEPGQLAGVIGYRIEWKGTGAKMPPSSITFTDETETRPETDVSANDEDLLLDRNDPRLPKHKRIQLPTGPTQIQRSKKQSVLPFNNVISSRLFLLKLRGTRSDLDKKVIPLTEERIRKNMELLQVIQNERKANNIDYDVNIDTVYNPMEGVFKFQTEETRLRIKNILKTINSCVKHVKNTQMTPDFSKFKLVDEIINEYSFEQMVSPIVVFFQDLFTQKRKLGPRKMHAQTVRENVPELQISVHVASASNVPTRESSSKVIGRYRKARDNLNKQINQVIGFLTGYMGYPPPMPGGYGMQRYPGDQQGMGYGRGGFNDGMGGMGNMGNMGGYGGMGGPTMQQFQNRGNPMDQMMMRFDYNRPNGQTLTQTFSNIERVRTFLDITYGKGKNTYRRTSEAEGAAPQWNQPLSILYNFKQEQSSVQDMYFDSTKKLRLSLFDFVEQRKPTQAISQIRIKKTNYYLGSLQIPFSSLISLTKVSGMFRLTRPIILFGYCSINQPVLGQPESQTDYRSQNPGLGTYVNLGITLNPLIQNSVAYNSDRKFITGYEDQFFLQDAKDWIQQLDIKRYIRLWVNNARGQSVFISRFLYDVEPPNFKEGEAPEKFIQRVARFVSLIPDKSRCQLLEHTQEFHLTCEEFLDAKMGDDHAFLLCNYFNYIDRTEGRTNYESYVIVGKAFPEGKTYYVLRRDKQVHQTEQINDFELWNPKTGEAFCFQKQIYQTVCCCFSIDSGMKTVQISKNICPLIQVGCVVSSNNVYVNIQPSTSPSDILFDLENDKHWKPFLSERTRSKHRLGDTIKPYCPSPITQQFYDQNDNHDRDKQIELSVYEHIKNMMRSDRTKMYRPYTFKFNQDVSFHIRDNLLMKLENLKSDYRISGIESKFYSQRQRTLWNSVLEDLQNLKNGVKNQVETDRKLYGFPLNFMFTTLDDVWERVEATKIHLNEEEDIQFVVSVRCFKYPCFVNSLWIFLGTIE